MSHTKGTDMNKSIEQSFVKTYIDKKYQERVIFELSSAKKRTKALSRFSHNAETALGKSVNIKIITDFSELRESNKTVYVISWDENDGMQVPLEDAINYCENTYTSLMLIGNHFSLIKEEVESGKAKILYLTAGL